MEYMLLPKLLALSQRAWSQDPAWTTEKDSIKAQVLYNQDWSHFVNVLGKRELPRLNQYAGGFNYRIPTVGTTIIDGKVAANIQFPGLVIRYTTDGTEPTASSVEYTALIPNKGVIRFKAFDRAGRGGRTIEAEKLRAQ